MLNNPCIDCGDNEAINGFRCFGCDIDYNFSEVNIFQGETNEECFCDKCVPVCAESAKYPLDKEECHALR